MIIEDEPEIRMLVRLQLERLGEGWEVVAEAASAEEAIDLTCQLQPDVIVLDNQLAGDLTGVDAAPTLRAAAPDAAIVLFSASAPSGTVAGVDAVVSKTDPLCALMDAVVRVSGGSAA